MERLTEANWKDELEKHPFFRTQPLKEQEKLPELFEALQAIKYEDEDASLEEKAMAYKEDGNYHFREKNFESAIKAFTKGIYLKCEDDKLNSVLYLNRATAHYNIKNYRSCLNDSKAALDKDSSNVKAISKSLLACLRLGKYEEAKHYCQNGLKLCTNEDIDFYESKLKFIDCELIKLNELEAKKMFEENKKLYIKKSLREAFNIRHIKLVACKLDEGKVLEPCENQNEMDCIWDAFIMLDNPFMASPYSIINNMSNETLNHGFKENHCCLYLEDSLNTQYNCNGILHWPILFLYPQHNQTDFIADFSEEDRFNCHIEEMLPGNNEGNLNNHPIWDTRNEYNFHTIEIYWEDKFSNKFYKINKDLSLQNALYPNIITRSPINIQVPMLTFIILLKNSSFTKKYIEKYNKI